MPFRLPRQKPYPSQLTLSGLSLWDGRRFENFSAADGLAGDAVDLIAEDSQGRLYFLSSQPAPGVCRWDGKTLERVASLAGQRFRAALGARDGSLWLGAWYVNQVQGVSQWKEGRLIHYSPAEGLGATYAWSFLEDADSILWFGHAGKVSLYDGHAWSIRSVDERAEHHAEIGALAQTRDGAIWLGQGTGSIATGRAGPFDDARPLAWRRTKSIETFPRPHGCSPAPA